jgi:GT2 family glycosyltransferase
VCASFGTDMAIEYVHLDKPGRSGAMQHMAERIGEGLLIFTDDDVRVSQGLVSAYAQAAQQHGQRAVYGGPLSIDYESPPEPWLIEYLPPSAAGWDPGDPAATIDRPSFLGANIAIFAQTLLTEGGFNPALGVGSVGNPVGEEFDLQQRLFDKGYEGVYVPGARVWHYVPRSRCSARWALKRHERVWFTNGKMDTTQHDGPHIAGAPRWMWRQLISLGLQAAAAGLMLNAHKRFEIKKEYYQHKGFMRGLRNR